MCAGKPHEFNSYPLDSVGLEKFLVFVFFSLASTLLKLEKFKGLRGEIQRNPHKR